MDFFLDTSALFKLFVQEELSEKYLTVLEEVTSIHVSSLSWVEFHSALRRKMDTKEISAKERDHVLGSFKKDWKNYLKVHISETVLESAADLVSAHSLKSLDAIQLASALHIHNQLEEPVVFLTADRSLQAAAQREK